MTDQTNALPAPPPALDLAPYRSVLVVRTDAVEGHEYRRGERHAVDAATLRAMRDKAMLAPADMVD